MRGKVLNTEKAKLDDVLKNEELNTIIYTVGAGVGSEFNVADSNYDKIIIMTDADDDGSHIQILLLTFFYKYMRPMIEAGKVYIALPPLYRIQSGKGAKTKIQYAWTNDQLTQMTKKIRGAQLQRFKGLGEMNADQLWETTMNPVTTLIGDKVAPRRKWIEENVQFTLSDDEESDQLMENRGQKAQTPTISTWNQK